MKRELEEEDELYVVHMIEDVAPLNRTIQLCREWGTAMTVARDFMADVCSEEWGEHEIPACHKRWFKAKWTWGFSEVTITVENVL